MLLLVACSTGRSIGDLYTTGWENGRLLWSYPFGFYAFSIASRVPCFSNFKHRIVKSSCTDEAVIALLDQVMEASMNGEIPCFHFFYITN